MAAELTVQVEAELYRYDLATALRTKGQHPAENKDDLRQWLVAEDWVEKDAKEIQEAAGEITGSDELETVREGVFRG